MKKLYNSKNIENFLYNLWEKKKVFKCTYDKNKKYFCIVMPPPNITGNLHMGHAFQQTIMDILIRYNKMHGKNVLWQAGTDHAGIATQMIVERKLFIEENKTRENYTRNEFVKKIWNWKKETNNTISNQIRRMGSFIDWERELFTLDKSISQSVQHAFISLYKKKLIYRKKTLVNWDSKLKTVISDIEIEHCTKKEYMWYIKYYFVNYEKISHLTVATTRPETIFADTAVAVNPKDLRYKQYIGKKLFIPLANRIIKIISDDNVDMSKGTGCVKITPAHSFIDYDIALKHKLLLINMFTKDGKIYQVPKIYNIKGHSIKLNTVYIPKYLHNLNRFDARKKIVKYLKKSEFIDLVIKKDVTVPYGDRTGEIIEPRLTNQWFLKIRKLSKIAIQVVQENKIKFIPAKYKKTYFSWMTNLKDWCISRQLWWGHQIPVWFDLQNKMYVGLNEIDVRKKFFLSEKVILKQESDVLDTWFSSALWICSSLGWPNKMEFFKKFYPTNVLVSGFDIIFFWIARIIMLSMYFIKDDKGLPEIPFKKVYITGLIRDDKGQKMSKSKGNVIDPMDIIDGISLSKLLKKRTSNMMNSKLKKEVIQQTKKEFPNGIEASGTDALRLTFASLATPSRDIYWDTNRLKSYKNFCNKLWNASRFVLTNLKNDFLLKVLCKDKIHFFNKWILIELNNIIKIYTKLLDSYRFDIAVHTIVNFVKNIFCDWYLEFAKILINNKEKTILYDTKNTLIKVLETILRLLHPLIPFITENIWIKISYVKRIKHTILVLSSFPIHKKNYMDKELNIIKDMLWLQQMIIGLRNLRSEFNISVSQETPLFFLNITLDKKLIIRKYSVFLKKMTKFNNINVQNKIEKHSSGIVKIINGIEVLILINSDFYKEVELQKILQSIKKLEVIINKIKTKLLNKIFLKKAPKKIILLEKKRLIQYENTLNLLFKKKYQMS